MNIKEMYAEKLKTADEAAQLLQSGMDMSCDIATGAPVTVINALAKRILEADLHDTSFSCTLETFANPFFINKKLMEKCNVSTWFASALSRGCLANGTSDFYNGYYYDNGRIMEDYLHYHLFLQTAAPMDENGYFSVGLNSSTVPSLIKKSDKVILEVNPNMPYMVNGPKLHISEVAVVVEADYPIFELPKGEIDETSKKIGEFIAEQIPDGATIQLGIGSIPDAVGSMLMDKKHLGIHTEMFTDSMVDLLESGAADNSLKPINTGCTVATFAMGSRKMYDYMDHNPLILMQPAAECNRPSTIAKHPNFMSINAGLEVDFFGQVCSESIGPNIISGTGGQVDYVRGAVESVGGKSFIAFPSTAKNGTVSRIKSILTPGAIVTTSKNDTDMIVTEYGIAKLRGQSLKQRVKNLIAIAHPNFREELTFEAKKRNLLL